MRTHYNGSENHENLHIERMEWAKKKGLQLKLDDILLSQVKRAYSRRVTVYNFVNDKSDDEFNSAMLSDKSEQEISAENRNEGKNVDSMEILLMRQKFLLS